MFHRLLPLLSRGFQKFAPMASSPEGLPSLREELCLHVDTLLTILMSMPVLGKPAQQQDRAACQVTRSQLLEASRVNRLSAAEVVEHK